MPTSLFFVGGAPGAGKSHLAPLLAARARGRLLVADMDELLDSSGALFDLPIASESGEPHWAAYNELWLRLVALQQRSGIPVLLFGPLTPSELDSALDGRSVGHTRYALLDCPDGTRRSRLAARGWSDEQIAEATVDAEAYRKATSHHFLNDGSPERVVEALLAWATGN